jgi:integrase
MPVTPRGTSWQASVTSKGQRWRRDFDDRRAAELWEAESKARILKGLTPETTRRGKADAMTGDGRPQNLEALFKLVAARHWRGSRGEKTAYLNGSRVVELIGPSTPLSELSIHHVDRLKERLLDEGNSTSTVNRKLASLSKMVSYGAERGWITQRVIIKRMTERQHRIRYFTDAEEARMLAWCRLRGFDDLHDLIVVGVDTGLRMGELTRLEPRDVTDRRLTVWGEHSKSGKDRSVPLTARVRAILEARRGSNGPYFLGFQGRSFYELWGLMRADLGFADDLQFIPHTMRHTFCSRLAMRGANAPMIMALAGHSTLAVTTRYMHLSPATLEVAINLLNPTSVTSDTCVIETPVGG